MAPVHLHYWAGAKAAAGTAEETVEAETRCAEALGRPQQPAPTPVPPRDRACSLLIDGVAARSRTWTDAGGPGTG